MWQTPLKAVRIIGPDKTKHFDYALKDGFAEQDGCLIIGDGKTDLSEEEIRAKLEDKIDQNTQIHILAHGRVDQDQNHQLKLAGGIRTSDILKLLGSTTPEPIQVYIDSCKSGAANKDIDILKQDSVLITSCSHDDLSYNSPFNNPVLARNIAEAHLAWPARTLKRMTQSAPLFVQNTFNLFLGARKSEIQQKAVSPEEMFMHSLRHASQTQTFNKKRGGSNLQYTYRPFLNRTITHENTAENFVNWAEADFMRSCIEKGASSHKEFSHNLPIKMTDQETRDCLLEHICYLITIKKITSQEVQDCFQNNNINPDLSSNRGLRPLDYAASTGNTDAIDGLIKAGADPNALNAIGCTSMFYAARDNTEQAIQALAKVGADPKLPNKSGITPIETAAKYKRTKALEALNSLTKAKIHLEEKQNTSFVKRLQEQRAQMKNTKEQNTKATNFTERLEKSEQQTDKKAL